MLLAIGFVADTADGERVQGAGQMGGLRDSGALHLYGDGVVVMVLELLRQRRGTRVEDHFTSGHRFEVHPPRQLGAEPGTLGGLYQGMRGVPGARAGVEAVVGYLASEVAVHAGGNHDIPEFDVVPQSAPHPRRAGSRE
ncbi:hypothetical protein GCM10017687_29790 [Streptomyces echinatus]